MVKKIKITNGIAWQCVRYAGIPKDSQQRVVDEMVKTQGAALPIYYRMIGKVWDPELASKMGVRFLN